MKDPRVVNRKPLSINQSSAYESSYHKPDAIMSLGGDKFDNIDQLKVHRGPLNLNAITMRDPNVVIDEICSSLGRLSITYKKLGKFNIKCEFKDLKFIVEINYVEKFPNLFIIKFYKNNQSNHQYFDLCSNIFAMLNL